MLLPVQLLVTYSAAHVRLFFRIYFIILGIVIGPLGRACSVAAAKLKLSKGKDVKLTEMLGWLGGLEALLSVWKLRAFPSGPVLTLFMLIAYIVGLASDLVGTYIRTVEVHDECLFGTGLVLSSHPTLDMVPANGYPYTVIQQALSVSLTNDGLQGIYAKVNQDPTFSANQNDVLGTWNCIQNSIELDYPTSESFITIVDDLVNHDLLYNTRSAYTSYSQFLNGTETTDTNNTIGVTYQHIVVIDTSNDGTLGVPWDVRACVSTYNAASDINTMLSFQCKLDDSVGWLNNILEFVNTLMTIPKWSPVIQGACYSGTGTPARANVGTILESNLNTLVMVCGGNNNLLDSSQASSTQGCLTNRTWVLWEVVGLAVIAALLNVLLLGYLVVLKVLGSIYKKREHYSLRSEARVETKKELESVPGDFLEWTSQAAEESRRGDRSRIQSEKRTEVKDLKRLRFGWRDSDNRFGILREGEHSEEVSLLVQRPK